MALVTWFFTGDVAVGYAGQNQIVIAYPPVSNLRTQQRQIWMQNRFLEDMSKGLAHIKWPRQLGFAAAECGQPNAFYNPQQHSISICYELADELTQLFSQTQLPQEQQGILFAGTLTFILLHEAGHAVIGEFEIPAVGREEDAADQFAALAFVADPNGERLLMGPLWWFRLRVQQNSFLGFDLRDKNSLYADTHGVDEQRFYNLTCWLYGSNPSAHKDFLSNGMLTPERAQRCPYEYQKIARSWDVLLKQNVSLQRR